MLHHVSIEIDSADADRMVELWAALGFERVEGPRQIADAVVWVERQGTQVHLILTPDPAVPRIGHAAVVVEDFDRSLERLERERFEVEPARKLWGERRAFVHGPGGHRVEVMAAPPPPAVRS